MDESRLTLSVLKPTFAICQLDSEAPVPAWAQSGDFHSVVRTAEELSIVCPQAQVPHTVRSSRGWRCLKVSGPLDLALVGVLASLSMPLAREGISVFALSTYDTDYLLVRTEELANCVRALSQAGHSVMRGVSPTQSCGAGGVGKERDDE